jgi:hypothetical protein
MAPVQDSQPVAKIAVDARADIRSIKNEIEVKNYEPISQPENIKRYVSDYFADIPLLARIAGCESHYRMIDKKGNIIRGEVNQYDVGVMQINELYHKEDSEKLGFDIYTLEGNVAYARYLYEKQGAKPWVSSSACWSKPQGYEIAINK